MLKNYKELKVWEKSYQLCLEVYRMTKGFPKNETYGLMSQMKRAALSIPRKQTLESLNPRILDPFLLINWEMNLICQSGGTE